MSRADLRADLRQARLLSWGTLGARRLADVLRTMARAGEVTLTPCTVEAVALRPPRIRQQWRPRRRPLKARLAEGRARRVIRRKNRGMAA